MGDRENRGPVYSDPSSIKHPTQVVGARSAPHTLRPSAMAASTALARRVMRYSMRSHQTHAHAAAGVMDGALGLRCRHCLLLPPAAALPLPPASLPLPSLYQLRIPTPTMQWRS